MRLWFAPSSEVPIYRQLVTQVVLAILAGDLRPGDKLPSTRELARRFGLHPNTISAGYRQLERDGWTVHSLGSGVFVRANAEPPSTPEQILDQHIAGFFRAVRELNLPAAAIRQRVAEWIASPPPDHFLLIDPDAELRAILLAEIGAMTDFPAVGASVEDGVKAEALLGAIPLCRPSKAKGIREALPSGVELVTLQIRSAHGWLGLSLAELKGSKSKARLLGVVSGWLEFVEIARTMLVAAGLEPEELILRDTRQRGWSRGLEEAAAILCDAHPATLPGLPKNPRLVVFPLLADAARDALRRVAASAGATNAT
jgi:DNA-binding transcriptional regulator YhcF (GntR family)